MSIAQYSDLTAAMTAYLNRSDLVSQYPTFVGLCEDMIANGSTEAPFQTQPLRIRAMEASADMTISTQATALPTGYIQMRRLYLNTDPSRGLKQSTPEAIYQRFPVTSTGVPIYYATEGEDLIVGPPPDSTYTAKALYYKRFTRLSADADTNWLLTNASGVYLWGSLMWAYRRTRNMDQAQACYNSFQGAVNAVQKADSRDRYSGSVWAVQPDVFNPGSPNFT